MWQVYEHSNINATNKKGRRKEESACCYSYHSPLITMNEWVNGWMEIDESIYSSITTTIKEKEDILSSYLRVCNCFSFFEMFMMQLIISFWTVFLRIVVVIRLVRLFINLFPLFFSSFFKQLKKKEKRVSEIYWKLFHYVRWIKLWKKMLMKQQANRQEAAA